jgi:hypothetical protein
LIAAFICNPDNITPKQDEDGEYYYEEEVYGKVSFKKKMRKLVLGSSDDAIFMLILGNSMLVGIDFRKKPFWI